MSTQHQFKTNQLGITYSEFGENLYKQLEINKQKLNGTYARFTQASIKGQSGSNQKNARRI